MAQEAGVQDKYSSDEEDVWATEDEDYYGNDSDSSQDESNGSRSVSFYTSAFRAIMRKCFPTCIVC